MKSGASEPTCTFSIRAIILSICCTYEVNKEIKLVDDGFFLKCPKCNSEFEIGNGTGRPNSGPASKPLKKYYTSQNSTQKIRIYN